MGREYIFYTATGGEVAGKRYGPHIAFEVQPEHEAEARAAGALPAPETRPENLDGVPAVKTNYIVFSPEEIERENRRRNERDNPPIDPPPPVRPISCTPRILDRGYRYGSD